jgi:hypothetical protein
LWHGEYKEWNPITIDTPPDGNCLFHAILNATSLSYRLGKINNKDMPQLAIVNAVRADLSTKLNTKAPGKEKTYYEELYDGHIHEFADHVPEFTLRNMQQLLKPGNAIGYGYLGYLSDVFNIDLYVLDGTTNDIYISDELPFYSKGNRDSVVLRYVAGHYELVGLLKGDEIISYFSSDHLFIKFLYRRVYNILYTQKKIAQRIIPVEYKLQVSKREYDFFMTYQDVLSSVLEVIETPDFDPSKWKYNRRTIPSVQKDPIVCPIESDIEACETKELPPEDITIPEF